MPASKIPRPVKPAFHVTNDDENVALSPLDRFKLEFQRRRNDEQEKIRALRQHQYRQATWNGVPSAWEKDTITSARNCRVGSGDPGHYSRYAANYQNDVPITLAPVKEFKSPAYSGYRREQGFMKGQQFAQKLALTAKPPLPEKKSDGRDRAHPLEAIDAHLLSQRNLRLQDEATTHSGGELNGTYTLKKQIPLVDQVSSHHQFEVPHPPPQELKFRRSNPNVSRRIRPHFANDRSQSCSPVSELHINNAANVASLTRVNPRNHRHREKPIVTAQLPWQTPESDSDYAQSPLENNINQKQRLPRIKARSRQRDMYQVQQQVSSVCNSSSSTPSPATNSQSNTSTKDDATSESPCRRDEDCRTNQFPLQNTCERVTPEAALPLTLELNDRTEAERQKRAQKRLILERQKEKMLDHRFIEDCDSLSTRNVTHADSGSAAGNHRLKQKEKELNEVIRLQEEEKQRLRLLQEQTEKEKLNNMRNTRDRQAQQYVTPLTNGSNLNISQPASNNSHKSTPVGNMDPGSKAETEAMKSDGNLNSSAVPPRSRRSSLSQQPTLPPRTQWRPTVDPSNEDTKFYLDALEREDAKAHGGLQLVQCDICERMFMQDRLEKHRSICGRKTRPRKVFDPVQKRLGENAANIRRLQTMQNDSRITSHSKKSNWRQKHEDLVNTLRYAREWQEAKNKGGKASDLPPPPVSVNADYVQCPHCQRRFSQKAAERHMRFCKENSSKRAPAQRKRF